MKSNYRITYKVQGVRFLATPFLYKEAHSEEEAKLKALIDLKKKYTGEVTILSVK